MLRIRCQCGKSLRLGDELLGKPFRCPACAGRLRVVSGGALSGDMSATNLLIVQTSTSGESEQLFLAGDQPIVIGKAADAGLRLQAPSVSRHHSILSPTATGWNVRDNGSTNGTFVNGESVQDHSLADGDVISIGDFTLSFCWIASPGATAVASDTSANGLQLIADDELDRKLASQTHAAPSTPREQRPCPNCGVQLDSSSKLCVNCGTDLRTGKQIEVQRLHDSDESPAMPLALGSYIRDCLASFLLILGIGNLIKFVFITVIGAFALLNLLLPFGGGIYILMFRFIAIVVCLGWICSYLFSVIVGGAAGDKDLPDLSFDDGIWDDGFAPFFKFLGTWALVLVPAFVYALITWRMSAAPDEILTALIWFGVAMWPFVALVTAIGGLGCLTRPDLMARTILQTFIPYATVCALTAGAFALAYYGGQMASAQSAALGGNRWATAALIVVLNVGCWIVAMRCIGLYYHHFKDRFAWSWG